MSDLCGKFGESILRQYRAGTFSTWNKPKQPVVCPGCGAIFDNDRWGWGDCPEGAIVEPCPACARIESQHPAGLIEMQGDFVHAHRQTIIYMARQIERRENRRYPLKRIMSIRENPEGLSIATTDMHLAWSIGDAVHHAYDGQLEYKRPDASNMLHVVWRC